MEQKYKIGRLEPDLLVLSGHELLIVYTQAT